MMRSYTELDLLRFIYKEVEVCEYFEMDYAVKEDSNLKEEFQALKTSIDGLPNLSFNPASTSIQNILGYATA